MITTYNRPKGIYKLTKALKKQNPYCTIVVVDDATKKPINKKYIDVYEKNKYNNGRQKWYKTVNILWYNALKTNCDLYIMLVDDALPNDNFFRDTLKAWRSIKDNNKIAMHLANNGRIRNWTGFDRVSYNKHVYLTQTTETSFIGTAEFISRVTPPIPKSRWVENPALGSGVFNLLNKYWIKRGKNIYGVKKSLIHANPECEESVMNYKERIKNPWILK